MWHGCAGTPPLPRRSLARHSPTCVRTGPAQGQAHTRAELPFLFESSPPSPSFPDQVDEAISTYQEHHKWEDAIRVAEAAHHGNATALKQQYLAWLLETGQEEQVGRDRAVARQGGGGGVKEL